MNLRLGDMMVTGDTLPPVKLIKALAVVSDRLHRSFARNPSLIPNISLRSCVLCSLTVKEFLTSIGFEAVVRPVSFLIFATEGEKELYSLGMGPPFDERKNLPKSWIGHMVVAVEGWIIDTTLYPAIDRPAWRGLLPPMMAVKTKPQTFGTGELTSLASLLYNDKDYYLSMAWFDTPENTSWVKGGDALNKDRRIKVVKRLIHQFGPFK